MFLLLTEYMVVGERLTGHDTERHILGKIYNYTYIRDRRKSNLIIRFFTTPIVPQFVCYP